MTDCCHKWCLGTFSALSERGFDIKTNDIKDNARALLGRRAGK